MKGLLEKLQKLKKTHKIGILAGTVIILGFVFFLAVWSPSSDRVTELNGSIKRLKGEVATLKQQQAQKKRLDKEKEEIEKAFKRLQDYMPEEGNMHKLLEQVANHASDAGLIKSSFKRSRGEMKKEFYAELPFTFVVRGGYLEIANFFDRLGQMDRIVNVSDFTIKPAGKSKETAIDEEENLLTAKCEGSTYRLLTAAEIKSAKEKKKKGKK